jgi:hypothetical protein
MIFRSANRGKPLIDKAPIGIDYDEFLNGLIRIAAKGKGILNQIAAKLNQNENKPLQEK